MIEAVFISSLPLILAAMGGLVSERAGTLNIALEGCMGAGAFTAAVLASSGFPIGISLAGAIIAGLLAGLLLAATHLGLRGNLFIAGLGINILLPTMSGLASQVLYGQKGVVRMASSMRGETSAYVTIPLVLITGLLLQQTAYGRKLRAAGHGGVFLAERGIDFRRIRLEALLISSGMASLAGALLTMNLGVYVPGMSAGKGWIALIAIWLGFRQPLGVVIACFLFSTFEMLAGQGQSLLHTHASLAPAFPYIASLLALIILSVAKEWKQPHRL